MSRTPLNRLTASLARGLERLVPLALLTLAARLALAAIFFLSGRTKVDGLFTIKETTYYLFAEEYRLPLIPSDMAAVAATAAEHLFPILLVLGLFTRLSALALLAMTLVIQVFVYPDAWPTHLSWATLIFVLLRFGAGPISIDRLLGVR